MYSFVTVVYEEDFPFLLLQAQSLALYLSPSMVKEIIVIDNGLSSVLVENKLRFYLGPLHTKLKLVKAKDITSISNNMHGWYSQQVLKLAIANSVESDNYVVLDAKNHLAFPLASNFFERNGKLRTRLENYTKWTKGARERFLKRVGNAGNYFKIQNNPRRFTPAITPVILNKNEVIQLVRHVTKTGNFADNFYHIDTTEFILYFSWLMARKKLNSLYEFTMPICPDVWDTTPESGIPKLISQCKSSQPFFSIHQRAWHKLSTKKKQLLMAFWKKRGLAFHGQP